MNVIIIESIPLLLKAISGLIEARGNSVLFSDTGYPGVEKINAVSPDLVWLDATIAEVRECSWIKTIREKMPEVKILFFGTGESVPEIRKYFKQGVCGYLPKLAGVVEIETALACVEAGELYVPASLSNAFASWLTDPVCKKKPGCKITHREQEILQLIVEEFTTHEIAKKLYISHCTVETHRINLIQKLGVKNTAGLVRVAFEAGLYRWSLV